MLRRRRWLVAAVTLITLAIVVVGVIAMPLYYRATAVVMPSEAAMRNPLGRDLSVWADGIRLDKREQEARLPVFMSLVKSPDVIERTQTSLGLKAGPQQIAKLVSAEPAFGAAFSITVLDRTPEGAVRLANSLAQNLRDYYQELSRGQSAEDRRLLEERVGKLRQEMQAAEKDISSLRGDDLSPSTDTENDPAFSRAAVLQAELDSVRAQLSEVQERRRKTERELALQPQNRESVTSTTGSPVVTSLQQELARLEQELVSARIRYTEKHRQVVRLKEQIEQVKGRLSAALQEMTTEKTIAPNPLRAFLEEELVKLKIEEAALRAGLSARNGAMADNRRKVRAATSKAVDVATRRADYDAAQEAYRRVSGLLQAALIEEKAERGAAEIRVLQEAAAADGPVPRRGPKPAQLLVLGILLSLGLGLGAGLLAEFMDDSVWSAEDIHQVLQLPLSGTIPEVLGSERKELPQITRSLPVSPYAECYRFLRTSILCNGFRHSMRTLMFSSAAPAQGTSTTLANLALSLAEAGRRVVLVDADLRRPMLHVMFKVDNARGLTNVLAGETDLESAVKPTGAPNLFLLPAGPQSENPSALINSDVMKETLKRLEERFEYVLVDSPPVLAFSESVTLATLADGTVLVIRVGDASMGGELQAKAALEKAGARILGVVLNGLSAEQIDSFHFHSHYYQHRQEALPERSGGAKNQPRLQ
jgi:capsular exopolysaccharide synthesis family protein